MVKIERPKGVARERILVMGPSGSGKTTAWMDVARNTDAMFYVLDCDFAVERMLAGVNEETADRVEHHEVMEWPDFVEKPKEWGKKAESQDWLVVDMISTAWEMVQEYFVEQVFDDDMDQFFLQHRKDLEEQGKKGGSPLEGFKDWQVINKMYRRFTNTILRWPGNVMAVAPVDRVNESTDEKETVAMFGDFGVKPRGQKHTAHLFHTVLLFRGNSEENWRANTIKDRERSHVKKEWLKSFSKDYLVKYGGWKVKKG